MHEILELKEMLLKELEEYGKKGDLSAGSLEIVDKLAHSVKNLCKVIEDMEESDYSSYGGGMPYRGNSYNDGRSYARGRGSNARRDSMGRYSRNSDMVDQLRDMMHEAPDEKTRQEIQRLVTRMEQM